MELYRSFPPEVAQILLVLFLSFLIGLEREEHKAAAGHYGFGGVRTFPLIGLIGYSIALLSGTQLLPVTLGFLVIAGFLLLSYWHKLAGSEAAGVTSEMSGLATYLVGALVYYGHFWIATALSVASLLLLELKVVLEELANRIPAEEILTFAKFLLLSAVILPILPNREFGLFHQSIQDVAGCRRGKRNLIRKLCSAEGDRRPGRFAACFPTGRSVLVNGYDHRDGAEGRARGASASFLWRHFDGVGRYVSSLSRPAGIIQRDADGGIDARVLGIGRLGTCRRLDLVSQT